MTVSKEPTTVFYVIRPTEQPRQRKWPDMPTHSLTEEDILASADAIAQRYQDHLDKQTFLSAERGRKLLAQEAEKDDD